MISYACTDPIMDDIHDRLERRAHVIRSRIESDPEELDEAVVAYWTGLTLRCDGPETLTVWTQALAGAAHVLDAVADAVPDDQRAAYDALMTAAIEAKRRKDQAVEDVVDMEIF